VDTDTAFAGPVEGVGRRRRRPRVLGRHEDGFDLGAGVQGTDEELHPLDDEDPFGLTDAASADQPAQPLDPLVPEPERRSRQEAATGVGVGVGGRAALASPTSWAKASGSVTARSARTFRSTVISAWRSPAMSRL
jgi:hypothetical protein